MRRTDRLAALGLAAGATGLGLTAGGRWLLHRQAGIARGLIGKPWGEEALNADRVYKKRYGDPIDLLILGDSIAAGLGAEFPRETLGARLSRKLAKEVHRSVRLRTAAIVGAESSRLPDQLASLPKKYRADVAVIVIGGNDVTHRVPVSEAAGYLEDCVKALRERGTEVVVGTCPDLGALTPVPQPLRSLGARASRQLAMAQQAAVIAAGGRTVSLATVVGPFFITNPEEMFSLDRFHPSALGYKRTAEAMLPSILAALGVRDELPFGHAAPG
ncbi:MAG: hypothetical protein NVSMB48_20110 [Marmoricola sp.]